jgi:hypothetical protein
MNQVIYQYLLGLRLGEMQQAGNISAVPLFSESETGLHYLSLDEAMKTKILTVTETSLSGSVPELRVVNKATWPILLLDGEELVGAKQNRVMNTTILVKEKSETLIPVSCCESGRWEYASPSFMAAPEIMPSSIRCRKMQYVSNSLRTVQKFDSQQGDVWKDIQGVQQRSGIVSKTKALKDVFEAKANKLDEYIQAFPLQSGQQGILFFNGSAILGLDVVSLATAYKDLHPKLIRSYTLDIPETASHEKPALEQAKDFIMQLVNCNESHYPSPGYGTDYRYEDTTINGSALLHQKNVIHAAFFRTEGLSENRGGMAGFQKRASNLRRTNIIE